MSVSVCASVCTCVRERERQRESGDGEKTGFSLGGGHQRKRANEHLTFPFPQRNLLQEETILRVMSEAMLQ